MTTSYQTISYVLQFDPYGASVRTDGGSAGNGGTVYNPYLFHRGIQDRTTGLLKFGGRWYDPTTGTWTQQDTLNAPLDAANANRYAYVGDDPINDVDPTGRSLCRNLTTAAAVLGVVGAGLAVAGLVADGTIIGIPAGLFLQVTGGLIGLGGLIYGLEAVLVCRFSAAFLSSWAPSPWWLASTARSTNVGKQQRLFAGQLSRRRQRPSWYRWQYS